MQTALYISEMTRQPSRILVEPVFTSKGMANHLNILETEQARDLYARMLDACDVQTLKNT
jgi:hypothetical protein